MYKANLSYNQMNSYLEELLEKEFIEKTIEKKSNYLLMTDKGFNFTQKIREMKDFEKTFGL
jgi:predicted transcriptional regulator